MNKSKFLIVPVLLILTLLVQTGTVEAYGGGGGASGGSTSGTRIGERQKNVVQVTQTAAGLGQVLGAATSTTPCSGMYLTDYMRRGVANNPEQVTKLQIFLGGQGFFTAPTSGFFGLITEAAVKSFQAKYAADILAPWVETTPTGYVFKTTRAKINDIVCAGSEAAPKASDLI